VQSVSMKWITLVAGALTVIVPGACAAADAPVGVGRVGGRCHDKWSLNRPERPPTPQEVGRSAQNCQKPTFSGTGGRRTMCDRPRLGLREEEVVVEAEEELFLREEEEE